MAIYTKACIFVNAYFVHIEVWIFPYFEFPNYEQNQKNPTIWVHQLFAKFNNTKLLHIFVEDKNSFGQLIKN